MLERLRSIRHFITLLLPTPPAWQRALVAQGWKKRGSMSWEYDNPISIEYVIGGDGKTYPVTGNTTTLDSVILKTTSDGYFHLYGSGRFPPSWGGNFMFNEPICTGDMERRISNAPYVLEMLRHASKGHARNAGIEFDESPIEYRKIGRC